jgi:molecular chaperone GrpE
VKIPVKTIQSDENPTTVPINGPEQEGQEISTPKVVEANVDATAQDVDESSVTLNRAEPLEEQAEGEEPEEVDQLTYLKQQLDEKEQEAKEHYEARLRLQAEFDNFKKRKEKESLDFRKYANENFIQELLIVIDDFDRAIAAAEQTHKLEDFLKGVELIFEKFLGVLKKKGVKEIEAEGQLFNPEIHEAVTQIETDEVEEGTVVAVFQKGYYLHDRVILAPKVGVAKKKA